MKLYVFGNGFDQAHGLNTSYGNYREFVERNLSKHPKWHIVLDYYPKSHRFWSEAEKFVCVFDHTTFIELKKTWGDTFLNELLLMIHESFENFILCIEKDISNKKAIFDIDKNSIFMTFNYTSVLEDLYGVNQNAVMHLHNKAENAAMKYIFGLSDDDCILGHSVRPEEYAFYSDKVIGEDHDYIVFMKKTRKDTEQIIRDCNLFYKFSILQSKNCIDEIVIYGFSFSPADKQYINTIQMFFSPNSVKYKAYFYVEKDESEEQARNRMINNMIASACNPNDFEIINALDVKKL